MSAPEEEAKAVQEVAKTVREALPIVHEFGRFVGRVVGQPIEEGAGMILDHLRHVRWERQLRLMQRARTVMEEAGIGEAIRPLPLKVAVPLFEAATIEESDELQDLWARLLVNGINPGSNVEITRSLVTILRDFGHLEARLLQAIFDAPEEAKQDEHVRTARLPDDYIFASPEEPPAPPPEAVQVALWNLVRLGCITPAQTWAGPTIRSVKTTVLGEVMIEACALRGQSA